MNCLRWKGKREEEFTVEKAGFVKTKSGAIEGGSLGCPTTSTSRMAKACFPSKRSIEYQQSNVPHTATTLPLLRSFDLADFESLDQTIDRTLLFDVLKLQADQEVIFPLQICGKLSIQLPQHFP
jgi:hypothetical protein